MSRYDIFLSFSGAQRSRVEKIYDELTKRSYDVFVDWEEVRPGEPLSATIESALSNSTLFLVYYSQRYANRHACQFELMHALIADEREGGPGRLLVVNPEPNRFHIAPVELQDQRYLLDDQENKDLTELVERVGEKLNGLSGTFQGIDFQARPRSYGGDLPSVEPRVARFGAMWALRSALTRFRYPMTQRPSSHTAVLVGLAGAGKTTLIDSFVSYFGYLYQGDILRLDLGGMADIYADVVAKKLTIDPAADVFDEAESRLTKLTRLGRVLWVVDNLPPDLPAYEARKLILPVEGVDTILVTQGHEMQGLGKNVVLDGLTEDEALELVSRLYRWSDEERPELVKALTAAVSRHPMALAELARGAAARRGDLTFAEHVGRVRDGSSTLLEQIRTVFTERLQREDDPDRLTLLRLATVCAPDAVPVAFVRRLLGRLGIDEQRVYAAIGALRDAHLAGLDDGTWRVHALIRDAASHLADGEPTAEQLAVAAAGWLAEGDTPLASGLLPHARHLCDRPDLPADVRVRLLRRVAETLLDIRHPVAAARYFDRLLTEFPATAQDDEVLLAAARSHLQAGEHDRAARLARVAGDGVAALLVLAGALDAGGHFDESEPVWQQVITHPDLATAPYADTVATRLQWVRGRRLRGELREHRTDLHAILDRADELPAHLANQARLELAEIQMLTDQQAEARTLARRVVEHYEKTGAAHDPLAAEARFLLANADMTLGFLELKPDLRRWPKAEVRLRELLVEQEAELGMRNIATLTTRVGIGWALVSQGKAVEARDHTKPLLDVLGSRTGPEHPLYLRATYVLGMAYFQLGKFQQAIEHLTVAQHGQLVALGEAHPETLRTQFELGMAFKLRKRPDNARGNALVDRVRLLSPKVTGRLNDLYGQAAAASAPLRYIPSPLLRWAHRRNHQHKWREDSGA